MFQVRTVNILSLQSHAAYGHVGNSAAAFALEAQDELVHPSAIFRTEPL
jgi:pyridoxal/pyridoxine/pyridoxamine kinase